MDSLTLNKLHLTLFEILTEIDRICRDNDIKYFLDSGSALGAVRHGGFIPWDDDIDIGMLRKDYEHFLKIAQNSFDKKYFLQTRDTDDKYNKLHAKVRKNDTIFLESIYDNKKMHCGVFVDIFPFDKVPYKFSKFFIWLNQLYQRMFVYKYVEDGEPRNRIKLWLSGLIVGSYPNRRFDFLCKLFNNTKASGLISYNYFFREHFVFDSKDFSKTIEISFEGKRFYIMNGYDNYLKRMYGDYMQLPPKDKQIVHELKELKL